jgi:two-component system, LuxR family, sensor kinase FixL
MGTQRWRFGGEGPRWFARLKGNTRGAAREREFAVASRLAAIVESSPDAILAKTLDGTITRWNGGAEHMYGYTAREAVGRSVSILIPPDRAEELRDGLERAARGELVEAYETRRLRKDGTALDVSLSISPIRDSAGIVVDASTTARDITDRKRAEVERISLQAQLVGAARQAGMSEIASNVLHNVGNALNSVNVSANVVAQKVRESRAAGLSKAVKLMDEHASDLGDFLSADPRGRALPGYLAKLAMALAAERDSIEVELRRLSEGIAHTAEIVSAQQSLAGAGGLIEQVNLADVIDDALRMAGVDDQPGLTVTRDVADVGLVALDRHRLLLILVNLITNAAHATAGPVDGGGQLTVRVEADGAAVTISVVDNGEGIAADNLTRIFAHGFTTQADGHGFGLHSSSLAAKEMGGVLSVHSDGAGCGARFVLEVPSEPELVPA